MIRYIGLMISAVILSTCGVTNKIGKDLKPSKLYYHLSKDNVTVFNTLMPPDWAGIDAYRRDTIGCPAPPPGPRNLTTFDQGLKMLSINTELIMRPQKNNSIDLLMKNKTEGKITFIQNLIQNDDGGYIPSIKNKSPNGKNAIDYVKDPSIKNETGFAWEAIKCMVFIPKKPK